MFILAQTVQYMIDLSVNTASLSTSKPLIRLQEVEKVYETAAGPFTALKKVSFEVQSGEFLTITGKSGAGKTTLVNMITGTDHLTAGNIWVGDLNIHQMNEDQLSRWRGKNLGVVYQSFLLMPNLSLLDNVLLPMDFCGLYRPITSRERAMELLRQVELEMHAKKLPAEISGGQQQRVAIARALANDPPIIVADEPTGRLDSTTSEVIFDIFSDLAQRGKTIIMVTHDRSQLKRINRSLTIQDGEVFSYEV